MMSHERDAGDETSREILAAAASAAEDVTNADIDALLPRDADVWDSEEAGSFENEPQSIPIALWRTETVRLVVRAAVAHDRSGPPAEQLRAAQHRVEQLEAQLLTLRRRQMAASLELLALSQDLALSEPDQSAVEAAVADSGSAAAYPPPGGPLNPIETIRYWADAYANPASGDHFQGHGKVVELLREYADYRLAHEVDAYDDDDHARPSCR